MVVHHMRSEFYTQQFSNNLLEEFKILLEGTKARFYVRKRLGHMSMKRKEKGASLWFHLNPLSQ